MLCMLLLLLLLILQEKFAQIFSYASQHATDVDGGPDFMDDAIRIERCAHQQQQQRLAAAAAGAGGSGSSSGRSSRGSAGQNQRQLRCKLVGRMIVTCTIAAA
jgi:hypothetical protein